MVAGVSIDVCTLVSRSGHTIEHMESDLAVRVVFADGVVAAMAWPMVVMEVDVGAVTDGGEARTGLTSGWKVVLVFAANSFTWCVVSVMFANNFFVFVRKSSSWHCIASARFSTVASAMASLV